MTPIERLKGYCNEISCAFFEREPMSEHTTFKTGGPADLFLIPSTVSTLSSILTACKQWEIPRFVLGNGSNVLFSDNGYRGVVINISSSFANIESTGAYTVRCGSGAKLSALCNYALQNSLSGLEFAWGIPGSVGGAAYMNAGAYDGEMKNVLLKCEHITADGEQSKFEAEQLDLSYRHSIYSDNDFVITAAEVKLHPENPKFIRSKMDSFMQRRKDKQPIDYPSAGSVFKRPPNNFAGTLVEECGLKGFRIGGAEVSTKHAGFIINTGTATSADVIRLIEKIKEDVFLKTGIVLECEIKIVGK